MDFKENTHSLSVQYKYMHTFVSMYDPSIELNILTQHKISVGLLKAAFQSAQEKFFCVRNGWSHFQCALWTGVWRYNFVNRVELFLFKYFYCKMLVRCLFHKILTSSFYRHFQEKTDSRKIVADAPQSCGCKKRIRFLKHGVQWIRKVDRKGAFKGVKIGISKYECSRI